MARSVTPRLRNTFDTRSPAHTEYGSDEAGIQGGIGGRHVLYSIRRQHEGGGASGRRTMCRRRVESLPVGVGGACENRLTIAHATISVC